MAQTERPVSSLMSKLQEALERDMAAAAQQSATVSHTSNPLRAPSPYAIPASRVPPAAVQRPNFTSAAIAQGSYIEPQADSLLPDPAFTEEDLTAEELNANSRSRRGGLIFAIAVILAGAAAIAAFIFILSPQQEATGPVPEIRAGQTETKVPPAVEAPSLRPIEPIATTPPTPPVSMGEVSTELVAPTTDGLSPARRIGTTRILLDGDKEIKPQ